MYQYMSINMGPLCELKKKGNPINISVEMTKKLSCELSSIGRTLYMQGTEVRTPIIPLIHFNGKISNH
jgi:hypothetical protein